VYGLVFLEQINGDGDGDGAGKSPFCLLCRVVYQIPLQRHSRLVSCCQLAMDLLATRRDGELCTRQDSSRCR